tara:strand:- start:19 stop:240 length:222 start_codon:yes stop_codon:yes gene_type:complete
MKPSERLKFGFSNQEKEEYKLIFELIDKSNSTNPSIDSREAEVTLFWKGVYNADFEMETEDKIILKYYEDNWC